MPLRQLTFSCGQMSQLYLRQAFHLLVHDRLDSLHLGGQALLRLHALVKLGLLLDDRSDNLIRLVRWHNSFYGGDKRVIKVKKF